jgi:hypothetical protein
MYVWKRLITACRKFSNAPRGGGEVANIWTSINNMLKFLFQLELNSLGDLSVSTDKNLKE